MKVMNFINNISPLILAISTIVLVVITYCYLRETKLIRIVAQKSLQLESAPNVFIENVRSERKFNYEEKKLKLFTISTITNSGITKAKKLTGIYELFSGNNQIKYTIGPFAYLSPKQKYNYESKVLEINLSDENASIIQQAIDSGRNFIAPEGFIPEINFKINLKYYDLNNEEYNDEYNLKYVFNKDIWVYVN